MSTIRLSALLLLLPSVALAGDVSVRLDAGSGFSVRNATGAVERLRVDETTGNISRNGALFVHTSGTENTFVGSGAGNPGVTGSRNSAFGSNALLSATTVTYGSAFGESALRSNTTGALNTAVDAGALRTVTIGCCNIYLANNGVAGENGQIKIGTAGNHTGTTIAGIVARPRPAASACS